MKEQRWQGGERSQNLTDKKYGNNKVVKSYSKNLINNFSSNNYGKITQNIASFQFSNNNNKTNYKFRVTNQFRTLLSHRNKLDLKGSLSEGFIIILQETQSQSSTLPPSLTLRRPSFSAAPPSAMRRTQSGELYSAPPRILNPNPPPLLLISILWNSSSSLYTHTTSQRRDRTYHITRGTEHTTSQEGQNTPHHKRDRTHKRDKTHHITRGTEHTRGTKHTTSQEGQNTPHHKREREEREKKNMSTPTIIAS